jgi:hypothetical protein
MTGDPANFLIALMGMEITPLFTREKGGNGRWEREGRRSQ